MPSTFTMLDIGLGLVGLVLIKKLLSSKSPAPLPPGPKGLPLLGNMLDMPSSYEWVTFSQWGEKYGEYDNKIATLTLTYVASQDQLAL
jgi:hypothetical protein